MWIHGYFHLIGYDHKKLKDFEKMNKKENSILQYFHKIN
jgi:ssRNA-specific RNase YbeY (16S rRNA maturation enzyme)